MTAESAAFPAGDITALLTAAAAAEAGGRFRVSVTWGPEITPTPTGPVPVPHWIMLVSCMNPAELAAGPRLFSLKDLGYGEPTEAVVRALAREAVGELGELARRKLSEAQQ